MIAENEIVLTGLLVTPRLHTNTANVSASWRQAWHPHGGSTTPLPGRTEHAWQVGRPHHPDQPVCEGFTRTPYISKLLKMAFGRNALDHFHGS